MTDLPLLDFPLPTCGSVHCDDARSIAVITPEHKVKGEIIGASVAIDEDLLDIFSSTSKIIPDWEPTATYTPYTELSRVYIDIETTRLDQANKDIRQQARKGRIMSIGVRNESGVNKFIRYDSERRMLEELFKVLETKQPDLLIGHNSIWFDLPYIVERCEVLGVDCPFFIDYDREVSRFAAARICGRPFNVEFRAVHCRLESGKKVSHVDTYMLAIAYDAIARGFTSYALKSLPIQLKLRSEDRLDLGVEGIEECYEKGDWDTLHEYLGFDLEDTALLADRFVPEVVNQQTYFPGFTIQALATVGNGTKWNAAIAAEYDGAYIAGLPPIDSLSFKGGITFARSSFVKDVVFYDFSGQYPTCMIQYGICSDRDPNMVMLSRVRHGMNYRNSIKYLPNPTLQQVQFVKTVKPMINSAYGGLAAKIPFGDPVAGAITTAFARARLKWARKFIEAMGGRLVLSDTDSLGFTTELVHLHVKYPLPPELLAQLPLDASLQLLSAIAIGEVLKRFIPDGSKLDLDSINKMMFIPPKVTPADFNKNYNFKSVNARKLIVKHLGDRADILAFVADNWSGERVSYDRFLSLARRFGLDFPEFEALRKNYCKIEWKYNNKTGAGAWVLNAKGRFVKRLTIDLDKEFQQQFMLHYAEDPAIAAAYYAQLLLDLSAGSYPVEKLTVTRKIRIGENKLVSLGFGKTHDTVSFYQGTDGDYVQSGAYDPDYYITKVLNQHTEITCLIKEAKILDTYLSGDRVEPEIRIRKQLSFA